MIFYKVKLTDEKHSLIYNDLDLAFEEMRFLLVGNHPRSVIIETGEMPESEYRRLPRYFDD